MPIVALLQQAAFDPEVTHILTTAFDKAWDKFKSSGSALADDAIEAAAPSFRVQVTAAGARDATELERAIDQFAREPNGGLIVLPNPVTDGNRGLIIAMAARHRLPAAYAFRHSVADGGLVSYGIDLADQFRQAASYVDRILKGEKPSELPVQAPVKFELVINLRTAKALGLDVPWILQQRADEVIE
jgi:putative tryptophan/tyrosine transport system substrate-binding protein